MELSYCNEIDYSDYNRLREEVKWGALPNEQAKAGLDNSAFIISCKDNDKVVASARLLWDGGSTAYLCDVMVSPKYQRNGIGKKMISEIINYLKSQLKEGWKVYTVLVAAKGKEAFYEKVGFIRRPNEDLGSINVTVD